MRVVDYDHPGVANFTGDPIESLAAAGDVIALALLGTSRAQRRSRARIGSGPGRRFARAVSKNPGPSLGEIHARWRAEEMRLHGKMIADALARGIAAGATE